MFNFHERRGRQFIKGIRILYWMLYPGTLTLEFHEKYFIINFTIICTNLYRKIYRRILDFFHYSMTA